MQYIAVDIRLIVNGLRVTRDLVEVTYIYMPDNK